MKLLINHILRCSNPDYFESVIEILSFYNVAHVMSDGAKAVMIEPQKIVLSSEDVNHLLFDCLHPAFAVELSYSPLGGRGCDLSLHVIQR